MMCRTSAIQSCFEWLMSDEVLDWWSRLSGRISPCFPATSSASRRGMGKRAPWHEDSFYWSHMLSPMEVVTVWLAIDRSTRENGAMLGDSADVGGNERARGSGSAPKCTAMEVKRKPIDDGRR